MADKTGWQVYAEWLDRQLLLAQKYAYNQARRIVEMEKEIEKMKSEKLLT